MIRRLKIEYGDGILSLPKEGLLAALPAATEQYLKVLLLAASDDKLRRDYDACCTELRSRLDITQSTLERAFAFWEKAGILCISAEAEGGLSPEVAAKPLNASGETPVPPSENRTGSPQPETASPAKPEDPLKPVAAKSPPLQAGAMPSYTEGQCADIIAGSGELADLIGICQGIIGKIFTSADVEVIVALYDHLNLGSDYIANLFAYCAGNGKKSLRYIEKTALNLFDEGIDTNDALSAYIKRKEDFGENLSAIRRLIGASNRELTSREKKAFTCWLDEWKFEIDVITRAFEVTVDKINEPSVSYMNRVLENWFKSGLTTLSAVEASLETYKKNKAEAAHASQTVNGAESGFRTDEFFEAALKRSYRDKEKEG